MKRFGAFQVKYLIYPDGLNFLSLSNARSQPGAGELGGASDLYLHTSAVVTLYTYNKKFRYN